MFDAQIVDYATRYSDELLQAKADNFTSLRRQELVRETIELHADYVAEAPVLRKSMRLWGVAACLAATGLLGSFKVNMEASGANTAANIARVVSLGGSVLAVSQLLERRKELHDLEDDAAAALLYTAQVAPEYTVAGDTAVDAALVYEKMLQEYLDNMSAGNSPE